MKFRGKVLIAAPVHPVLTDGLEAAGYELVQAIDIRQTEAAALLQACVGVITSTRLQLDAALIDAAPGLRWIGRMGSGMEVIDVPYATAKGIACIGSPEGNCNAVAEHALGMLLGITKRIAHAAGEVKAGQWLREENRGTELEGKTIGIIGFGHTGRAFSRKLQGMDMEILAYDNRPISNAPPYVTTCADMQRIREEADILSFHVPMAADTFHYYNEAFAASIRKPAILLNTSRGTVVDAAVLPGLLQSGRLLGAGLDVWEDEPPERMGAQQRALLTQVAALPQVIVTPHVAGYTFEALYKMSSILLERITQLNGS
jgi:D-3-phosphoglycerate dehydrogenase